MILVDDAALLSHTDPAVPARGQPLGTGLAVGVSAFGGGELRERFRLHAKQLCPAGGAAPVALPARLGGPADRRPHTVDGWSSRRQSRENATERIPEPVLQRHAGLWEDDQS